MAKYAQLTATGLPHGVLLTIKDSTGKQVPFLYPEADANGPDNRARFADGMGAINPATYVPNGTYIVAYSGGSQTVVVAGASGSPADSMFVDLATQAELNAAEAADSGTYAPLSSAVLTGVPTAPNPLPFVRTPQLATTQDLTDSLSDPVVGPRLVAPPGALVAASAAAAWYTANAVTHLRFQLTERRTFRYVNLWVGTQSGNIQVGVVRMRPSGAASNINTLKVADSGIIACPAAGQQQIDLGFFTLPPGDYGLFLWCDNVTATFLHGLATGMTASRMMFSQTGYATGVLSTVQTASATTRWVSGLTLEAAPFPTVLLGDSITANEANAANGQWFSDMDRDTGYRFWQPTNAGVAGETTAQILTRTAAAVAGARYVTVLAGTNDIGNDIAPATTIANLTAIYNAIQSAGGTFCAFTIPPRSNVAASSTPLTPARAANLRTVNAWMRANYSSWAGAKLCDISWALSDGTDETSPLVANFQDYTHPNTTGAAIMKALLVKSVRDWV